jgi:dTDP-4-amino-4,6-dideoxygalactose transaminase
VVLPRENADRKHVYHLFVVRVRHRDEVAARLKELGVDTGLHYPIPLHHQEAYNTRPFASQAFPVTDGCSATLLSLPMFPELEEAEVRFVAEALQSVLRSG